MSIYSLHKHILNIYHVVGTEPGTEDREMSKRTMAPALEEHTNKLGRVFLHVNTVTYDECDEWEVEGSHAEAGET